MDRRQFIGSAAGLLGAGLLAGRMRAAIAAVDESAPFFTHHSLPLGLQLYTLDPNLNSDFAGTLAAVAAIGYRTVELAGLHGHTAAELRRICDAHGLHCTSMHVPGFARGPDHHLDGDLEALATDAHTLGVTNIVMPLFLFPENFVPPAGANPHATLVAAGSALQVSDFKRIARFLNEKGARLKKLGLQLGYHNHNFEFRPLQDGDIGLHILLAETDPSLVTFELDAGWAAAAGHDPADVLMHHAGRFTQLHVKDIKPATKTNYVLEQVPTEVGRGEIDWPRILPIAYEAGVRQFYVEQEPPYDLPRIEAVKLSYDYLVSVS